MTRSVAIDTSTLTAIDKSEVVRQLNWEKTSFSPVISWYPRIITVPMETEQLRRLRQLKRRSNIPHWRWLARTPVKILLVQLTYLSHKMSYSRHRFSFWMPVIFCVIFIFPYHFISVYTTIAVELSSNDLREAVAQMNLGRQGLSQWSETRKHLSPIIALTQMNWS